VTDSDQSGVQMRKNRNSLRHVIEKRFQFGEFLVQERELLSVNVNGGFHGLRVASV